MPICINYYKMKHPGLSIFIFISILFLLSACEYRLKDDYYRELNIRDSANIFVSLNNIDTTFILEGHETFTYKASIGDLKIIYINVFVDNQFYKLFYGTTEVFELWEESYLRGWHQIDIVVTTNSGSGSIADLLSAEGFVYTRSWKFHAKNMAPGPISITNIFNNNGALKIEWEKNTDTTFANYILYKSYDSGHLYIPVGNVTNQNTTSFEDLSFIGGTAAYFVGVNLLNGHGASGTVRSFTDDSVTLSARWIKDCQIELSWNKCSYNKAFKSYQIYSNDHNLSQEVSDINTTTLTGEYGKFGKTINYTISEIGYGGLLSSSIDFAIGKPFYSFGTIIKYDFSSIVQMTIDMNNKLYRCDVSSGTLIDSLLFYGYGKIATSPTIDVLLEYNPVKKRNPLTLELIEVFSNQELMSQNLSASSWGIARSDGEFMLYDYKNKIKINALNFSGYGYIYISDDNKYIFEQPNNAIFRCYKIDGSSVTLIWEKPIKEHLRIPGSHDKIMGLTTDNVINIINISTGQVTSSFPIEGTTLIDLDPSNKIIAVGTVNSSTDFQIDLYNYETGQKIKSLKSAFLWSFLKNGSIYVPGASMSISGKK